MKTILLLLAALFICAGVIGVISVYLWQNKLRTIRSQEAGFRSALKERLRKRGYNGLDFWALVREFHVSQDLADRAAEFLYAELYRQTVDGLSATAGERQRLDSFRQKLALPAQVAKEIEDSEKADKSRRHGETVSERHRQEIETKGDRRRALVAKEAEAAAETAEKLRHETIEKQRREAELVARQQQDLAAKRAGAAIEALERHRREAAEWQRLEAEEVERKRREDEVAERRRRELAAQEAVIERQRREAAANEERYRRAVLVALADGIFTEEEKADLEHLRSRIGLSVQQAKEIVGRLAQVGYVALFRKIIDGGSITVSDLQNLKRYREEMGISRDEANNIVRRDGAVPPVVHLHHPKRRRHSSRRRSIELPSA